MASSTTSRGVKLDADIQQRLKTLGELSDRSLHYLMKAAIESYLDREEVYGRQKHEDQRRWEQYQLTGEAVSQEEAAAWLEPLAQGQSQGRPEPRSR